MHKQHKQAPEVASEKGTISVQAHGQETAIDKSIAKDQGIATEKDIEIVAVLEAIKDQPRILEAIDLIPPELQDNQDDETVTVRRGIVEPHNQQQRPSIVPLREEQTTELSTSHSGEDKATKDIMTKDTSIKDKIKTEVISFRVTKEEYEQLHFQCFNEYGEQLLTISKLAKLTVLGLSKAKAMEQPLERYRLAIASEMAMAITALVHTLDTELEETDNEIVLSEHGKIIRQLENIQKRASMLLIPLTEQATH